MSFNFRRVRWVSIMPAIAFGIALALNASRLSAGDDPKKAEVGEKSGQAAKPKPKKPLDPPTKQELKLAEKILALHNKERAEEKLPPLELDAKLMNAARAHALDMAVRAEMTHDGADGSKPEERIEEAGFHGKGSAENVARWYPSPESVMRGWMKSPGHKKNILGEYRLIGVGRAVSDANDQSYWCVDFGLPWPKLDSAEAGESLIDLINERRETAKKPKLRTLPALSRAAEDAAAAAALRKGKPAKDEGTKIVQALTKADYETLRIGMAGATGQTSAKEVIDSWMNDPATSRQILGDFSDIGVGVAPDPDGIPVWRIVLAQPRK